MMKKDIALGFGKNSMRSKKAEPRRRLTNKALSPIRALSLPVKAYSAINYFTRVMSLNMGKYMAMTINPTEPPRKTMSIGSIIDVRFETALSTSSS